MVVNVYFNPLNAKLNPIYHLLALLLANHILHVCGIRLNENFNPLNVELIPICHLLILLAAHHILHISRTRVKMRSYCCDHCECESKCRMKFSKCLAECTYHLLLLIPYRILSTYSHTFDKIFENQSSIV